MLKEDLEQQRENPRLDETLEMFIQAYEEKLEELFSEEDKLNNDHTPSHDSFESESTEKQDLLPRISKNTVVSNEHFEEFQTKTSSPRNDPSSSIKRILHNSLSGHSLQASMQAPALVFDHGSIYTKVGFGGELYPRKVFPTAVGQISSSTAVVGREIFRPTSGCSRVTWPLQGGNVNWEKMTQIWESIYQSELNIKDPSEYSVSLYTRLFCYFQLTNLQLWS